MVKHPYPEQVFGTRWSEPGGAGVAVRDSSLLTGEPEVRAEVKVLC